MGQSKKPGIPSASLGASTSSSGHHCAVDLIITEDLKTPWLYHWSSTREQTLALCGTQSMPANLAAENWGYEYTGVAVQWCTECNDMKRKIVPDEEGEADTLPIPRSGVTLPED